VRRRWLAIWVTAIAWLALCPHPLFAHAVLTDSNPKINQVIEAASDMPGELTLSFSEPVALGFSRITLLAQSGQTLETGDVTPANNELTALKVSLPELRQGVYLVSWQALSTVDGHTTTGSFAFGVGVGQLEVQSQATASEAQITPLSTAARWLTLLGIVLLIGLFSFRLLLWHPLLGDDEVSEAERAVDRRFSAVCFGAGLLSWTLTAAGLAFTFIDQFRLYDGMQDSLQAAGFGDWVATTFGGAWMRRLVLLVPLGATLGQLRTQSRWPVVTDSNADDDSSATIWEWIGLGIAVTLAFTSALISHSAALQQGAEAAIAIDFGHVLAAGFWAGGLVFLALALWTTRTLPAESRAWFNLNLNLNFSALAALSVGLLLASGGYLAWQHVGSWNALAGTSYGLLLLAKVGLALLALAIAALNLLYVKPRLYAAYEQPDDAARAAIIPRFRRLVWSEALAALLILSAAGVLTNMQRAIDAPLLSDSAQVLAMSQMVEGVEIGLQVEPARIGPSRFTVTLRDVNGQVIKDVTEVTLRFTFLGQAIGAAEGAATSTSDGRYTLEGSYLSVIGPWQVEAAVRRPGAFDLFAPFRLDAASNGALRTQQQRENLLDWSVRWLTLLGKGASGALIILSALIWWAPAMRASRHAWQMLVVSLLMIVALNLGGLQIYGFFTNEYTPGKFLVNPIAPEPQSITLGRQLFMETCLPCHGEHGRGDGMQAATLPRRPADFTNGHVASHSDGDLFYWIRSGFPASGMPSFADQFEREEVWHLVNYVRRLSQQ
jgi:copper transport protein